MSKRVVATTRNLPGSPVKISAADTGYEPAATDHIHQLWTVWDPIDLTSPWANAAGFVTSACKISELVMVRGAVENTGAAQAVFAVLKPEFRPNKLKWFCATDDTDQTRLLQIEPDGEMRFLDDVPPNSGITTSSPDIRFLEVIYRIDSL